MVFEMSTSTAKKKDWFKTKCKCGCQICGIKFPGRKNNGLVLAHIIEDGPLKQENILALCPNCHFSFDEALKPALHKAITEYSRGKVPEKWEKLGD